MSKVLEIIDSHVENPQVLQYAFLVSAGLTLFVHVVFLAAALYFLSRMSLDTAGTRTEAWINTHANSILWLPAIFVIGIFLIRLPAPRDDLLAISAIAAGHFGHDGFAFSSWGASPASPWFGFEQIISVLAGFMDHGVAMQIIQALAVMACAISVTLVFREFIHARPQLIIPAVFLIGLVFAAMTMGRATNGRVESFFFAWAIAALWMKPMPWFAIGLLVTPMYWLAWIYAPAALLLKTKLRTRFLLGGLYAIAALSAWLWITDGRYLEMFTLTSEWLNDREVGIGENVPLLAGISASPAAFLLLLITAILATTGRAKAEDWPLLAVGAWFVLPDMLRYMPMIGLLAAIWIMRTLARDGAVKPGIAILLALATAGTLSLARMLPTEGIDTLPAFRMSPGSTVIGPLESGLYATIHHNNSIKVTPSFEIGATEKVVQLAARDLRMGKFDCDFLASHPVDYVLENRLKAIPDCLQLDQVQGTWRLWKTRLPVQEHAR